MEELLRNAAARGDSDQVVRLLGEGVKNIPDEVGRNALHLAAVGGHKEVVAALLQARWDANLQDSAGCTALQRAAAEGHLEVVKQLIKHGANVNIQDKVHGNTALHEASWKGYSKCVEALCQASKVNLQVKNAGGFAPLHLACQNGHNQSCRELLMANCNPDIQNNYGDTPLHTSARYGHAGVTRILISADCQMSDQNKNGDTALHITAAMGRRKLTRILLEAGCDPNKRNKQNERAKDIAIRKDLTEIIEIIDKTVPLKKKEKHRDKRDKEKDSKANDKKRGKESGSSKDSSTRPKEKKKPKNDHQVHFENPVETKWSPYGCHYYPDSKTFPKPKLDSLPHEPLKKGEQYYLDLAGNIRKGPVGVGYTCYCAPFFRHMEERLDRDKKELKEHIDAAQIRLDKKVTSLEVKTRSQLNEITRSMALERAKCQQRHLHLEQWLIRGSAFRNSEKVKPSDFSTTRILKSKSLENILEEKPYPSDSNLHRSVDILNDRLELDKQDNDDLKNRSSSREGKESGKGSSEVGDLGTSDGEDKVDTLHQKRLQEAQLSRRFVESDRHERKMRKTTREISERIDQILKSADNADGMGVIYDEMLKWKSYHNAYNERNQIPERKSEKENQRTSLSKTVFHRPSAQEKSRHLENRRSYHDILREPTPEPNQEGANRRIRRLSDPHECVEEPERKSVQEIVSKLQKQHTVQELVAKIQRKTGLIHKSAQKWKENKLKNKEKANKYLEGKKNEKKDDSESSEGENEKLDKNISHNYENIRQWDVSQEKLSQLPYRCRDTVYSPSPNQSPYEDKQYKRNLYKSPSDHERRENYPNYELDSRRINRDLHYGSNFNPENDFERRVYQAEHHLIRDTYGSVVDMGNELYGYSHSSGGGYDQNEIRIAIDNRKMVRDSQAHNYSPTQNDSGYSTKPYGGSSTGPSPSLSGQDFDCGSTEIKPPPYVPQHLQKSLEGRTSSLV